MSLVRSLHHEMSSHNDGSIELLTGKTPAKEDPTSTASERTPRLRHGRQPAAVHRPRRLARLCRRPPRAVHDAAHVPGHGPLRVRHGRPFGRRLSSAETIAGRRDNGARLDDRRGLVAQLDRYRRGLRPARGGGGDRPVPASGISTVDQHGRGRRLRLAERTAP